MSDQIPEPLSRHLGVLAGPTDIAKERRYNRWAFQPMLHQHFNQLRARMMNLAESSTRDKQQAEAMKGLMKDFINVAYYESIRQIEDYCRDMGVIEEGEGQQRGPTEDRLTAQGMQDILYEPEVTK